MKTRYRTRDMGGMMLHVEWRDSADLVRVILPEGWEPRHKMVRPSKIHEMVQSGELIPEEDM